MVRWFSRRSVRDGDGPSGDDARLAAELVEALGERSVVSDRAGLAPYGHDASVLRGDPPPVVCLPTTTAEVAECVRTAGRHGRPFVARGAGTGLAGGAVPVERPVVISTTRMHGIELDAGNRRAWVQPGVTNLELDRVASAHGLRFAPDPSSQQACTIGGNVANNSGGPHCLSLGVTSAHVLAVEVVLPDATVVTLGGPESEPAGYDLRGAFIGSEGTLGITTGVLVRLLPLPEVVSTLLCTFDDIDAAATCVSDVIAAGVVPAALEMMDGELAAVVEDFCGAGYPRDAAAVLLVELEGPANRVGEERDVVTSWATARRVRSVRIAADDQERAALWKGRKSAFGAIARIKPDYYLHDTVVPRTRLVDVLASVRSIAREHDLMVLNVFHAGDGNLHPLLLFDAREPGVLERVHAAGDRIVEVSLAAGGVLSGEHGIGLEKRDHMELMFSAEDIEAQSNLRCAFDPDGRANPHKVLPLGVGCGEAARHPRGPATGHAASEDVLAGDDVAGEVGASSAGRSHEDGLWV